MIGRLEYKYIVAIIFVFGIFTNLLDLTITNVALPTLQDELDASTTDVQWVVTAYLLALAVFIPVSGWAGDRFGTKRVFIVALAVFTLGSLLSGLAWDIESLIAFRVLQGIGGGMVTPVGSAMLFRAFPPSERAAASAMLTLPIVIAPASGPIVGGYLVEYQDWRWIFFINVPICLAGIAMAWAFLREGKEEDPGRLDIPGFLLSAFGLALLLYGLAEAGSRGFGDPLVLAFAFSGLALLVAFVFVELRTRQPMIDVRLFRNKLFSAANAVQIAGQGGLQGALFLLPLLLQAEKGLSPLESGLTTFPQAIGVALMSQPAGRIYRRYGPRRMMMAGMLGIAVTTFSFLAVDLDTAEYWIGGLMFLRGIFFALTLIPLQTATFATIEHRQTGQASAIFNAGRQVAASFGVALLATVLTSRLRAHDAILGNPATTDGAIMAFHDAFIVAAVIAVLGMIVSLFVDDREAAGTMAPPREERGHEALPAPEPVEVR